LLPDAPPPEVPVPIAIRQATLERIATAPALAARLPDGRASATASRPSSRPFVGAGVEGRYFSGDGTALFGGGAGASIPAGRGPLRLRIDAGAWYGRARDPIGEIDLWLVTGALGGSVSATFEATEIEVGPRVELGYAHAEGRTTQQDVATEGGGTFVSILSLPATGRVRLASSLWAGIDLELGAVLHGLRAQADDRASGGLRGAALSARFGLALAL
jgi:hypothetical protein